MCEVCRYIRKVPCVPLMRCLGERWMRLSRHRRHPPPQQPGEVESHWWHADSSSAKICNVALLARGFDTEMQLS